MWREFIVGVAALSMAPGIWVRPGSERAAPAVQTDSPSASRPNPDQATEAEAAVRLGQAFLDRRQFAKAEAQFRRSKDIYKLLLGEDHRTYAWHLNTLGCICTWTKQYTEAENFLTQAAETYKRIVGEDHPKYVEAQNNLAGVFVQTGEFARARTLLVQVLAFQKREHGEDHPNHAMVGQNLGLVFLKTGEYDRAELLFRFGARVYLKAFGEKNQLFADSLEKLGQLYTATGDYVAAEPFLRRALALQEEMAGPGFVNLAQCLESYAALLRKSKRGDEADALSARAKKLRTQ